jgi:hypothetical protein
MRKSLSNVTNRGQIKLEVVKAQLQAMFVIERQVKVSAFDTGLHQQKHSHWGVNLQRVFSLL